MRYQIRHARVQFGGDVILRDINFEVHDREKIAIVGRNGCGKTTLLKLIAGDIEMSNPDSDEECGITMAGGQEIGFLRQVNFVDAEVTVEDELKKVFVPVFACEERMKELEEQMKTAAETKETAPDGALLREYDRLQKQMEAMRGYSWRRDMETMFQRFGFALEDLRRPIGSFSGGQQTKVAFIKLLLTRPDIMLLDEPTNHLDLPTIEWLENYLKGYDKAVVIVSHDRMFLDKVADVTYEIEYHEMKRYPGNYTYFMQRKQEDLIKQEKDYEEQQKEIKRLTDWIEKWKNTPTKVAATRSKRMAIEHMVKIEKPRRFDTRAFHGRYTPRIESYTNVIQAKDLSIGYDAPLAEVSFLLQKKERLAIIGENGKGKSTLLKTLIGELPALGGSFKFGQNVEWGYFDQQKAVMEQAPPQQTVLENFWAAYPGYLREEVRSALGGFLFSGEDVEKKMGQLSGGEKVSSTLTLSVHAALAEDAAQETLLRAWRRYGTFRGEAAERTWITAIALNVCRDLLRSPWHTHRMELSALAEPAAEDAPWDDTPLRAVLSLPRKYREVVLLRYYEEFTLEEIADTLGIAPGTVSARLTRAKRKLRPMLEEWYYD